MFEPLVTSSHLKGHDEIDELSHVNLSSNTEENLDLILCFLQCLAKLST